MTLPVRLDGATLNATGEAVAVTPHSLASEAAVGIMEQGGNAADAAIAANAVLGVVSPEACGIGGDLFALIHTPGDQEPATLNSSGRAGQGAEARIVRDNGHTAIPIDSPFAVTVPGCIDGWLAISDRFGSMPLAVVLSAAVGHAQDGFPATPELSQSLTRLADVLSPQPASIGLYPNGTPPTTGTRVSRPTLAQTLSDIGSDGRAAFYSGPVADAIVTETGGVLRHEDLAQQQGHWVSPISINTMGLTAWTVPPNSQGYLALAAAWIFEHLAPPHDPENPRFTHAAIEAFRSVAWERDDLVADPDFAPVPAINLLDPERLRSRLERIAMDQRTEWPVPRPATGGTAYLTVCDKDGMGVSLIQSNFHGIGSRLGAGNAGFFLHDRGSDFTLEPGHPNELAPGKRPMHTLSPTLWTNNGELRMLLGTRGGDFQPQTLLQMATQMLWAGLEPHDAQMTPRWTTTEWRDDDSSIIVEPHLPQGVVDDLTIRGHRVDRAERWMPGWGPVSVITVDGTTSRGAADPRVASSAASAPA